MLLTLTLASSMFKSEQSARLEPQASWVLVHTASVVSPADLVGMASVESVSMYMSAIMMLSG